MTRRRIVLASASPRRKQLMSELGIEFEIIPSTTEESAELHENASHLVKRLAELKACDVAKRVEDGIVIGADTVVVLDDNVLGKPIDEADAFRMLKLLSSNTHMVYTGVCIIDTNTGCKESDFAVTHVTFRKLTDEQILNYIKTKEPMDKAGSYAIQGKGTLLIEKIDGEYTNVVGLPIRLLSDLLYKYGIKLL